ncbi:MAG: hypothetical protein A2655_00475 [Candidatus Yanofskybacteria bacterium RIFCSPHIGHO2_01_FULL_43_42]|uniref:Uncharacterized protein n=1 Tax=Candidatus Yanofskybacteria bacterium RIFCSPLOWO2_01_FULL_43_22 TaxID=1802695 RepID=A0A1F8GGS9_9BACT|nr:MAG: hypothetical protein A2655_00475 [Candidatus Yanofskybacteria bacterium RIFCSPHIGHO2_01_FULL_43_42]OGN24250.1 MAG: hypothetical protein A3A13_03670 [Candidatus Yanofskybacteria bacterium RIFCSPLOWO2_01_FULL_43_22]
MKNNLIMANIKWQYTLLVGLLFAVVYILLDDNNMVSSGIEGAIYYTAWTGIFATILLLLKKRS